MSLIYGIMMAVCVSVALLLLCLLLLVAAYIIYAIKDVSRGMLLHSDAKRHSRIFEADILEEHMSSIKSKSSAKLSSIKKRLSKSRLVLDAEDARAEILKRRAATDQRFVAGLRRMTEQMIKSVCMETVERNVETGFSLINIFDWGEIYDVKQISVAGMPVGKMFKMAKKTRVAIHTDKLLKIATELYTGNIPCAALSALPESDKLITDGGVK